MRFGTALPGARALGFDARLVRYLAWSGPLAAVLVVAAVVLSRTPHSDGENLLPRPDSLEYAVVAYRRGRLDPPILPIGDRSYPSRYPIGFPLLLVPTVLAGAPPHGLWMECALLALVGIALTYVAASALTNPAAGPGAHCASHLYPSTCAWVRW